MISIASVVEDIVLSTPFLRESIGKDLLNYSGFARLYQSEIENRTMKKVSIGSIVMALRRLTLKKNSKNEKPSLFSGSPEIIVRSNLFEITIGNATELISAEKKLLEIAEEDQNTVLTVTHGVYETTIIASTKIFAKVEKLYASASHIKTVPNICAITIKFSKNIIDTPGIIYTILSILAWHEVSLVEVVSTYSEFTLVMKQEDVEKVFSLTQKLFG